MPALPEGADFFDQLQAVYCRIDGSSHGFFLPKDKVRADTPIWPAVFDMITDERLLDVLSSFWVTS